MIPDAEANRPRARRDANFLRRKLTRESLRIVRTITVAFANPPLGASPRFGEPDASACRLIRQSFTERSLAANFGVRARHVFGRGRQLHRTAGLQQVGDKAREWRDSLGWKEKQLPYQKNFGKRNPTSAVRLSAKVTRKRPQRSLENKKDFPERPGQFPRELTQSARPLCRLAHGLSSAPGKFPLLQMK